MSAAVFASPPPREAGVGGAGLVTSKTTLDWVCVDLSPNAQADRRVKRLKKSVWASGHLHKLADKGHRPPVCWFVTLTYVGVNDWLPEHITKAVTRFRNWCISKGVPCRYTWVSELQQRGAVHYHLLAWLPVGLRMPFWDHTTRKRFGAVRSAFWPHGQSNTQPAYSGVGYLMKYLSKLGEFHRFPKGLRLYGIGGLNEIGKSVRQWLNLPEWVKLSFGVGDIIRKTCGFVVRSSGEILEPAYAVSFMSGSLWMRSLRELPARFHSGPYSSIEF